MEPTVLRQLLENLCTHSQWSYAVFWRLEQLDTLMFLTCEDEYCDSEKSQHQPCPIILCEFDKRQQASEHSLGHPIRSAVVNMSRCQYLLGEGMVGKVALGESCLWIYSDDIESTELISKFGNENEWLLPIAAGIKTTLLIPVLPFGVVQVGSFDKVVESQTVAAEIRDLFFNLAGKLSNPSSKFDDSLYFGPSVVMSELVDSDESSLACTQLEYEDMDINPSVEFMDNCVQSSHPLVPFMFGNCLDELDDLSCLIDYHDKFGPYFDTNAELNDSNAFVTNGIPEATEMWMFSCQKEEFYDTDELLKDLYGEMCADLVSEQVDEQAADGIGQDNFSHLKDFSTDYELQEAVVPAFGESNDWDSWSTFNESKYSVEGFGSLCMETFGPLDKDIEQDMVAGFRENSDDTISDQCNSKSSITSSPEKAVTSDEARCNIGSEYQTMVFRSLTSPPSLESIESAVNEDEEQQEFTYELVHKNSKVTNHNKEKPKNNCRPRPRDRQLIQDRLKELRKLVPDGAKCSIDGLLDHTRKHMMFLKNAIEQANKVKKFKEQEARIDKSEKANQASIPLEVGNKNEACPIVVKDLEHSNQFLIQMVCNDEEVFFEMAEVMHKLKLTILKGAIENRSNKWACFIVEASKGFNKLDIFWPLMRILHQNGNWMTDQRCP